MRIKNESIIITIINQLENLVFVKLLPEKTFKNWKIGQNFISSLQMNGFFSVVLTTIIVGNLLILYLETRASSAFLTTPKNSFFYQYIKMYNNKSEF